MSAQQPKPVSTRNVSTLVSNILVESTPNAESGLIDQSVSAKPDLLETHKPSAKNVSFHHITLVSFLYG